MDRQKLVEVIAEVPAAGPTGVVGHATANSIADAMDRAGILIALRDEVKPKGRAAKAGED